VNLAVNSRHAPRWSSSTEYPLTFGAIRHGGSGAAGSVVRIAVGHVKRSGPAEVLIKRFRWAPPHLYFMSSVVALLACEHGHDLGRPSSEP
jgi:hypothetical protein